MSETLDPVREFITRSLVLAGGVVENAPGGLEALLPASEAERFGVGEDLRIHLAASSPPDDAGALDGRLGSHLLERLVANRLERPAMTAVALPAGLPLPVPDRLPVLLNAVRAEERAVERRHGSRRFLAAELRVTLEGEELRSTLQSLTIRLDDGARVEPFRVGGAFPVTATPLTDDERANAAAAIRSWLWRDGPALHASAIETLRRRASRDLEHLAEYYRGLDGEMAKAVDRARSEDERSRRRTKWAALPADLDNRRDQLRTRIRPRLAARLIAARLIDCDAIDFDFAVRRRNRKGLVTVHCRTADGVFEGPACASCGTATVSFYLCDDRLHVLCEKCGQPGRLNAARCRACHGEKPERPRLVLDDPTARLRIGAPPEPS